MCSVTDQRTSMLGCMRCWLCCRYLCTCSPRPAIRSWKPPRRPSVPGGLPSSASPPARPGRGVLTAQVAGQAPLQLWTSCSWRRWARAGAGAAAACHPSPAGLRPTRWSSSRRSRSCRSSRSAGCFFSRCLTLLHHHAKGKWQIAFSSLARTVLKAKVYDMLPFIATRQHSHTFFDLPVAG